MNNCSPLVSVIAVCYNHSNYLNYTLDSIRNQTYSNLEVLVIDSFSSDNSLELIYKYIQSFGLQNWRVVSQKKKTSICENLNLGLSIITGQYYQVISCDDIILPNKISNQVAHFLSKDENFALIYGDYSFIDENSNLISDETLVLRKKGYSEALLPPHGSVFCKIIGNWSILSITCLIKTEAAKLIGGYDENLSFEDTDFILRLSRKFYFTVLMEEVAYYRIVSNSFYNTRSLDFYISSCVLYMKHLDVSHCRKKVKRLISHYFDTVFSISPVESLKLFNTYSSDNFNLHVRFYILSFKIFKNYKLSLLIKKYSKKFFKKWN